MANKDGILSIGIEYKSELNKMIADLEGGLDTISKNNQLSKGMKQQFDNVIAEVRSFKATMEKELATLGSGKVDKTAFKSFKQTVANNFKSVREDIDRLDLAVSTLNSQMEIISKGVDLSKITKEFASFEDYVNRTNEAVSQLIDTLGQQGISLFSFDNRNLLDTKSKIKEIDDIIRQLDNDKGAKFKLFDEKEAQAELDRLSVQIRSTLELMEHTEKQMSNMDSSTVGFKKMQGDFALLQLKAASLNDTIEMLYTVTEDKGISSIEMDEKSFELYDKYTEYLSDNLESIVASAKNAKKELLTLLTSQKQPSVKVSSEMNPNSSELSTTVTIETTSSELWKKLSPVLTDLQGILNSNPVVAPVKLVVAPNAISSTENGDVGKVSNAYSKKYAKILVETGEDAVIDLEGVYKKTFTSIMDAGVSYAKETISKIQDIFDKSPINIKYDISQEEIDKIQNFVLSNKDGKKVDISGQITKAKQEVEELNTNIEKTSSLLQETQSKGNVKFEGFDKFTNDLSKSINKLEELQNILKALQNIEVTLAKASGLSSITEIESQWESLEKRIINATKVDGSFRKNASVSKIASEYQKYIDMGGTNSIADIDKIKDNKDTLDTIISKAKEFAKQDLSNDSVKELSIELDGIIGKFDELIATVKTATNALYKIIKQGNVSDLDKQWSSISNKFKSIADESGKINLRKQKTDIKELMDMYQKYENAGGTNSLMSLTDNIETLHKLDKEYQKLNQTQSVDNSSTIEKESESFKNVEKSVNSLTTAIGDTKVQAINVEATAMEDAAEREILAINAIVDNLNMIVSKLKEIKGIKISKIQVESVTSTSPVETNISSENVTSAIEGQNKIQDELDETVAKINNVGKAYDTMAYRGIEAEEAVAKASKNYNGATHWSSDEKIARGYGDIVTSGNISLKNAFEVDGNGAYWDKIQILGDGLEENSKKAIEFSTSIDKVYSELSTLLTLNGDFNKFNPGFTLYSSIGEEISKLSEEQKSQDDSEAKITSEKIQRLAKIRDLYADLVVEYDKFSRDTSHPYGLKTTDELTKYAQANGYDGAIYKNIIDAKHSPIVSGNEYIETSNIIVSFYENQVKYLEKISRKGQEYIRENISNLNTNSPMKDVFQGNDKATTDSSTIAIKEESKALEQVSDSAKEASESKKKFSKSNKEVKASAESSSTSLNEEKAKLKEVGESAKQEAKAIQKLAEEKRKLRQQEKQSTQSSVDKALKDQIFAWKQIQSIREKIAKTDDSKEIVNLQQIKKEYQEQYINAGKILKTNSELYNKEVQLARLEEIRLNTNKNIEKSKNKSINSRISSYKKELSKYTDSSKYTKDFVSRVRNQLDALGKIDITNEKDVDRLTAIGIEVKKIISDSKLLENKLVKKDSILADIISQMKIFRARNTSMSRTQTSELTSLIDYAEQLEKTGRDSAESIENIKKSYSGLRAKVSETGNEGLNMIDRISQRAQDMNAKFFAQFFSFQDWIRYLREGFNIINEIDTSITELRKVSNGTENDLKNALSDATSAAKELGSSISDIVSMQADWSRLGYSIPDAEELARATQLYVNVGDNMTAETASENLISTLQGFQLDASEAENIIDRFNEVANNYAIDTQGIGEALKRSAASFNAANTSLSADIALVTTANAVVQDPDSIGKMMPKHIVICGFYYKPESSYIG